MLSLTVHLTFLLLGTLIFALLLFEVDTGPEVFTGPAAGSSSSSTDMVSRESAGSTGNFIVMSSAMK